MLGLNTSFVNSFLYSNWTSSFFFYIGLLHCNEFFINSELIFFQTDGISVWQCFVQGNGKRKWKMYRYSLYF